MAGVAAEFRGPGGALPRGGRRAGGACVSREPIPRRRSRRGCNGGGRESPAVSPAESLISGGSDGAPVAAWSTLPHVDALPLPRATAAPSGAFATTHWTVVVAAGHAGSGEAGPAMAALCETYWYPVYLFVRRQGSDADEALDLTQGFFARQIGRAHV